MSNMCSSKQFKSSKKKKQFRELYGPLIRTEMKAKDWLRHVVKESGHPIIFLKNCLLLKPTYLASALPAKWIPDCLQHSQTDSELVITLQGLEPHMTI